MCVRLRSDNTGGLGWWAGLLGGERFHLDYVGLLLGVMGVVWEAVVGDCGCVGAVGDLGTNRGDGIWSASQRFYWKVFRRLDVSYMRCLFYW
jgi:hypothetical protein